MLTILLRRSLYVLGAVLLTYVIAANLVLNTSILDGVIKKKQEKMLVEWESGWTVLPGFLHMKGLRVRGQTLRQQWQFSLGEADARISLLALANRTVRVGKLRGNNFHFRIRPRLTEETKDGEGVSHYPPIEGLSNPPDPAPEDIYPPKKKKKKRGWIIDLSNVYLEEGIELWVSHLKLSGTGSVAGDFDFEIREDMFVDGAVFDLNDGEIAIQGETFVNDLHIATDLVLGPFNPKEAKGMAILDHLYGNFTLENGTIPRIEIVNDFIAGDSLQLVDGTASFDWVFEQESVEADSTGQINVAAQDAGMLMGGRSVSGDLELHAQVEHRSLGANHWILKNTTVSLDSVDIDLLRAGGELEPTEASEDDLWWGRFTVETGTLDIAEPSEVAVAFDFELKNTEPLIYLFLSKEKKDGSAKLPTWAKIIPDITNVVGSGRIDVTESRSRIDDLLIEGDNFAVTAWLESQGDLSTGRLYLRHKRLDLGMEIEDSKTDMKILRPKKWAREQPGLDQTVIPDPD